RIVEDARFDAKLTRTNIPGEPRYPSRLVHYYATHLKTIPDPSFLVDTSGFHDRKREAILAYESQFVANEGNRRIVEWVDSAATYFGSRIGAERGEPFFVREPLGLTGLGELI
ncbi:MAG: bacillithiol biosynthesis deacetylase BshB1, partial [Planctomycetota bacterium]|nr:bacillithiol biosynthesis deacetylase BshB1 [Planctomycetota bacterium]